MTDTPAPRRVQPDQTAHIDHVAGTPPVPITVWRTPGDDQDGDPISTRLAYRLVAGYTDAGDTILDLTGSPGIASVAAAGKRTHIPAHITRAGALRRRNRAIPTPPRTDLDTIRGWFTDDPTTDSPTHAPGAAVDPGPPALVVATTANFPAGVAAAAARVLPPGGCLVIIAATPSNAPPSGDYTELIDAVQIAGFGYLQHIVAVGADIDGDQFIYYATDDEMTHAIGHARIHTDLLVFTTPGRADD
jgi:hypothetical protein